MKTTPVLKKKSKPAPAAASENNDEILARDQDQDHDHDHGTNNHCKNFLVISIFIVALAIYTSVFLSVTPVRSNIVETSAKAQQNVETADPVTPPAPADDTLKKTNDEITDPPGPPLMSREERRKNFENSELIIGVIDFSVLLHSSKTKADADADAKTKTETETETCNRVPIQLLQTLFPQKSKEDLAKALKSLEELSAVTINTSDNSLTLSFSTHQTALQNLRTSESETNCDWTPEKNIISQLAKRLDPLVPNLGSASLRDILGNVEYLVTNHALSSKMLADKNIYSFVAGVSFAIKDASPEKALQILKGLISYLREKGGSKTGDGSENSKEIVTLQNRLALVLQNLGQFSESVQLIKKSIEEFEGVLGKGSKLILTSKSHLAVGLKSLKNYDEAILVLNDLLKELNLNQNQTDASANEDSNKNMQVILHTKSTLAETLLLQNFKQNSQNAIQIFTEVLDAKITILGRNHPETVKTKIDLASAYNKKRDFKISIKMFTEILKNQENALGGPESPQVVTIKRNLATAFDSQGLFSDAAEMYEDVLESEERALGLDHPDVFATRYSLAMTLIQAGKHTEGFQLMGKLVVSSGEVLGKDHPYTVSIKQHVAQLHDTLAQFADDDTGPDSKPSKNVE